MTGSWCLADEQGNLKLSGRPPAQSRPLLEAADWLLPPIITDLHLAFARWTRHRLSPGPITPQRVWITQQGGLTFHMAAGQFPAQLGPVAAHQDLAAWLVLLDKVMESYVVIARARAIWPIGELAGALPFVTPSLLPQELVTTPPDNWHPLAQALAFAVGDGPLPSEDAAPVQSRNRHWAGE